MTDSNEIEAAAAGEREYPAAAYINGKCINIVARIWHSPERAEWMTGALATGASEPVMLGGVAAWLRWRRLRQEAGAVPGRPNFVIGALHSTVWERFARLWNIEMRTTSVSASHPTADADEIASLCDSDTICAVVTAGAPWTGLSDDTAAIAAALDRLAADGGPDIPIHVDAAAGGFTLPFVREDLPWDFRTPRVASISTSDAVPGPAFPGAGWVCWRDRSLLPEGMTFSVNYMGLEVSQVGLNFSRPSCLFVDNYCRFVRAGTDSYRRMQLRRMEQIREVHGAIRRIGPLTTFAPEADTPVFSCFIDPARAGSTRWSLTDLQELMRERGWTLPVKRLPEAMDSMEVMPFRLCDGDVSERGRRLVRDLREAVEALEVG